MRDLGNTLIVVEHDEDTMLAADYIIDIGPGAGIHGGQVVSLKERRKSYGGRAIVNRRIFKRAQIHPCSSERRKTN